MVLKIHPGFGEIGTMGLIKSNKIGEGVTIRASAATAPLCAGSLWATAPVARADESDTSFWLPGTFGSLAALPSTPGWAVASAYYHTSVSAGAQGYLNLEGLQGVRGRKPARGLECLGHVLDLAGRGSAATAIDADSQVTMK
jgi:hypothetical protein